MSHGGARPARAAHARWCGDELGEIVRLAGALCGCAAGVLPRVPGRGWAVIGRGASEAAKGHWPGPGPFFPAFPGAREAGLAPRRAGSACFLVHLGRLREPELPVAGRVPPRPGSCPLLECLWCATPWAGHRCTTEDLDFWSFPSDTALAAQGFAAKRPFSYSSGGSGGLGQSLGLGVRGVRPGPRASASPVGAPGTSSLKWD